jgi:hypothetical protein
MQIPWGRDEYTQNKKKRYEQRENRKYNNNSQDGYFFIVVKFSCDWFYEFREHHTSFLFTFPIFYEGKRGKKGKMGTGDRSELFSFPDKVLHSFFPLR